MTLMRRSFARVRIDGSADPSMSVPLMIWVLICEAICS
jgi:hypothetical protein